MGTKTVKIGLVGIGRLGAQHAKNIAERVPRAILLAICSLREEDIKTAQEKWNIPYGYTDYDCMLKNKELDAIFIASPSEFHCEQIIKALDAGFHVFSEKPLGLNLEETYQVRDCVNKNDKQVFMLGFMRRYDQSYVKAKEKIDQGVIGEPIFIRCYGLDPMGEIDNYLNYAGKNQSGGLFLDMSIHDFDLARWLLGVEAKEVWAIGGQYTRIEFAHINDVEMGSVMVRFEDEKMGMFVASRNCTYGYHVETEIIGTKGRLQIGGLPERHQLILSRDEGAVREYHQSFLDRFDQAYVSEVIEFVHCILDKRQPEVTVEDGIKSTEIGYASRVSLQSGKLMKIV